MFLLKKSYLHKNLKEIKFNDLWNSYGVFTTMRVVGKPLKILFFKNHINNLIKSLKIYEIYEKNLKKKIIKFREDELHHKDIAFEEGASKDGLYKVLDGIIKTGSKIAIKISEKY